MVSQYADERKDAIQRVIAAMTVGKDVSPLFPDVLKNIATTDLEQKKLVYLYLMNYAKANPELCILAVNTFVQDTEDPNPLVRALAIRTMGCVRVDKMVDYMEIPLSRTLKDENPYVRKTAAVCVAKLFDLNAEMCVEQGFVDQLVALVEDGNPMVVANAVASIQQIKTSNPEMADKFDPALNKPRTLKKMLVTLNECTEWGRITILEALSDFQSPSQSEAQHIVDRVTPQLQHENPAVVLGAVKVITRHYLVLPQDQHDILINKLSAPLTSLLSTPPEIQYVGLRNIRILLEAFPQLLNREISVFFCKFNDPLYLKLEKIEILVRLCNESNSELLLSELKEYSMEFDRDFVDRAIRGIGQIAIKVEPISQKAVDSLYDLCVTRAKSVTNQAIIVLQELLRRYPRKYTATILPIIADFKLDDVEQYPPDTLSSYVWIVGEYCKDMPHLHSKLSSIVSHFEEVDSTVQLSILTTVVKVNLTRPDSDTKSALQKVLDTATNSVENVDVRDKAFIYWRLLSLSDSERAREIVLRKLPILESTIEKIPPVLLNELLHQLSTLASVYHKSPSTFVVNERGIKDVNRSKKIEELRSIAQNEIVQRTAKAENLLDFDDDNEEENPNGATQQNSLAELSDLFAGLSTQQPQPRQSFEQHDLFAMLTSNGTNTPDSTAEKGGKQSKPEEDLLSF